jgi:hypothetical protein
MGVTEIHSFKVKPKTNKKQTSEEADGSSDIGYVDEPENSVVRKSKKVKSANN